MQPSTPCNNTEGAEIIPQRKRRYQESVSGRVSLSVSFSLFPIRSFLQKLFVAVAPRIVFSSSLCSFAVLLLLSKTVTLRDAVVNVCSQQDAKAQRERLAGTSWKNI